MIDWILIAVIGIAILAVILIVVKILKTTAKLAVSLILNGLGGLFILLLANFVFNMGIPYDLPTLLISAIGGVPGAICVIILKLTGIIL